MQNECKFIDFWGDFFGKTEKKQAKINKKATNAAFLLKNEEYKMEGTNNFKLILF